MLKKVTKMKKAATRLVRILLLLEIVAIFFSLSPSKLQATTKLPFVPFCREALLCDDRDQDGICDEDDACPDDKGLARFKGCPCTDVDIDGVCDDEDDCALLAGDPSCKGCPPSKCNNAGKSPSKSRIKSPNKGISKSPGRSGHTPAENWNPFIYQEGTMSQDAESLAIELHPLWIELGEFEKGEYNLMAGGELQKTLNSILKMLESNSAVITKIDLVGTADALLPGHVAYYGDFGGSFTRSYLYNFSGEVKVCDAVTFNDGWTINNTQLAFLRAYGIWYTFMNGDNFWGNLKDKVRFVVETSGERGMEYRRVALRVYTDKLVTLKMMEPQGPTMKVLKF